MKKPNRVDITLLDDELRDLINTSARIFPVPQNYIDTNYNPNNYEYARVGRNIYIWNYDMWEHIGADDTDISWVDIKNTPNEFPAIKHNHKEVDISDLDKYTKNEIDTFLFGKSDKEHTHPYSLLGHRHDDLYAVKSTEVAVTDHEVRLHNIENGYTEGHRHGNLTVLDSITQLLIDAWNGAVSHMSDFIKHITSEERTLWNTVSTKSDKTYVDTELNKKANASTLSGHIDSTTIHVTQIDKDSWNSKADATQIPTKVSQIENDKNFVSITIGTIKPTDGSVWFKLK